MAGKLTFFFSHGGQLVVPADPNTDPVTYLKAVQADGYIGIRFENGAKLVVRDKDLSAMLFAPDNVEVGIEMPPGRVN